MMMGLWFLLLGIAISGLFVYIAIWLWELFLEEESFLDD